MRDTCRYQIASSKIVGVMYVIIKKFIVTKIWLTAPLTMDLFYEYVQWPCWFSQWPTFTWLETDFSFKCSIWHFLAPTIGQTAGMSQRSSSIPISSGKCTKNLMLHFRRWIGNGWLFNEFTSKLCNKFNLKDLYYKNQYLALFLFVKQKPLTLIMYGTFTSRP